MIFSFLILCVAHLLGLFKVVMYQQSTLLLIFFEQLNTRILIDIEITEIAF